MIRKFDIINDQEIINKWVLKSIKLFESTPYLDNISTIYPLETAIPQRLDESLRRNIISAHQSRNTNELLTLLSKVVKFPYDEPLWYLMKNIGGSLENNPQQIQRIANSLYAMTAEETVFRLESAPKLNTQMGPMFNSWLRRTYSRLSLEDFKNSSNGIFILDSSEENSKAFINKITHQHFKKRPDLVAKVNETYVVGEAKWIGSPGGNQDKQVDEVLDFCKNQRGSVRRIGIIDGFPWAIKNKFGSVQNFKTSVQVHESEYDIISALLLNNYLESLL